MNQKELNRLLADAAPPQESEERIRRRTEAQARLFQAMQRGEIAMGQGGVPTLPVKGVQAKPAAAAPNHSAPSEE